MTVSSFRPGLLEGQVAVVSGAGSGIGRVTALELADLGAQVYICGRRLEPIKETAGLDPHGRIHPILADIREEDQVDALVSRVLDEHARIDLLVNNAGGQFLAPAEAISPKGFRTVIRLNVEGTWLMTHAVATRSMIPSGGGKVISITLSPHNGQPGMAHSSAARAAVENLMRVLSIEWARFNIKLNAVAAGQIGTEVFHTKYPQEVVAAMSASVPLGRVGTPEEIAGAVVYLASPVGDFVSGTVLTVDGARDDWMGPFPPAEMASSEGAIIAEQRKVKD
ncbi:MAG TPA: SDR family oxidoreductase [Solirubrobacteraceae bacterium]|nr:SDR family oxidoreductase [Solirubrobacteraceae bacterium]